MTKRLLKPAAFAACLVATSSLTLHAQPYARGLFNGWGTTQMNDDGDGTFSLTTSGNTPNGVHAWKIDTVGDWSSAFPPNDAKSRYDATGSFTFNWQPGAVNDGWNPTANRVGYVDPGNIAWEIMGQFNNWDGAIDTAARQMTAQGGGLYTVDYTITNAPGTYAFKFRESGTWDGAQVGEGFGGGNNLSVTTTSANQVVKFRLDLPNGRWLAGDPIPAPTNKVTFLVNMEVPIALYDADYTDPNGFNSNGFLVVRGSWNGFGTDTNNYRLIQVGTTLFSNTVDVTAYSGATIQYKFFGTTPFGTPVPGEESPVLSCGAARTLTITNTAMEAPLAYWGDRKTSDPTVNVTYSVDMSLREAYGLFTNGVNTVSLRGSFNGWTAPVTMTNRPAPDTNIFDVVLSLPYTPIGGCYNNTYKFFYSPPDNWENDPNRSITTTITNVNMVLPTVYWNNQSPCDSLAQNTAVTFQIDMAGAQGTDGTNYDGSGSQLVYINGNFVGWDSQGVPDPDWGPTPMAELVLTKSPSSDIHTVTISNRFLAGGGLRVQYKYSLGGADNEAGSGQDHVRYIRTMPGVTNYVMPLDKFIGGSSGYDYTEDEIGGLAAKPSTPGNVQLQWTGLPCAYMQGSTNVAGPFTDLFEARGVSSTNVPTSGGQRYFRLRR